MARQFRSADSQYLLGSSPWSSDNAFFVAARVRPHTVDVNQTAFWIGSTSAGDTYFRLGIDSGANGYFTARDSGGTETATSTGTKFASGRPMFIAGATDAAVENIDVWVETTKTSESITSMTGILAASDQAIAIGMSRDSSPASAFNGTIEWCGLWDGVPADSMVEQLARGMDPWQWNHTTLVELWDLRGMGGVARGARSQFHLDPSDSRIVNPYAEFTDRPLPILATYRKLQLTWREGVTERTVKAELPDREVVSTVVVFPRSIGEEIQIRFDDAPATAVSTHTLTDTPNTDSGDLTWGDDVNMPSSSFALLIETNDTLLLEDGDRILIESGAQRARMTALGSWGTTPTEGGISRWFEIAAGYLQPESTTGALSIDEGEVKTFDIATILSDKGQGIHITDVDDNEGFFVKALHYLGTVITFEGILEGSDTVTVTAVTKAPAPVTVTLVINATIGGGTEAEPPYEMLVYLAPTSTAGAIVAGTVPISLTLDTDNVAFADARDVRVRNADGDALDFARISYDSVTGAIDLDVKTEDYDGEDGYLIRVGYGDDTLADASDSAATHDDFLAWWTFPDGMDQSGNGRHLIPTSISSTTLFGRAAGSFNGSTSAATLANASLGFLDGLSGVSWMAVVDGTGTSDYEGIFSQSVAGANDNEAGFTLQRLSTSSAGNDCAHFWAGKPGGVFPGSYIIGTAGTADFADTVMIGVRTSGVIPKLWQEGARIGSMSGQGPSGTLPLAAGDLVVGRGARTGSEWSGKIGVVAVRDSAITDAQAQLESLCWVDAARAYGVSEEVQSVDVNDPPVAVDFIAEVLVDSSNDLDVISRSTDPDGDTLTLVAVGTPTNGGTVTIVANKARYVAPGSSGDDTFTFTVEEPAGKQATATCRVTRASVSSGQGEDYWFTPPPIPADTSKYKIWNISNTGTNTPPAHAENDFMIIVLPLGGFRGQITNTVLNCSFAIWGGSFYPTPTTLVDGYNGRIRLVDIRLGKDIRHNGGRPFGWISNVHHDNLVNNCEYADWLRLGSERSGMPSRFMEVYVQKCLMTGRVPIFSGDERTHSDIFQGDGKQTWEHFWADNVFIWANQGHFMKPGNPAASPYNRLYPGQTVNIANSVYYTNPKHPNDTRVPGDLFKPFNDSYVFAEGKYFAFTFDQVYVVPDADVTPKTNYFDTASYGGSTVSLSGTQFVFPPHIGGDHTLPLYSGTCYHTTPASLPVTLADVGDSHRVTTAEQLLAVWPGGTY